MIVVKGTESRRKTNLFKKSFIGSRIIFISRKGQGGQESEGPTNK